MKDRILLVDDEVNILRSYQRTLRNVFQFDVASSGKQALEMIELNKPYSVVISDMQMPEMNGVELLSIIKERYPETVRMMLTGNSDQQTAIDAVNIGDIFRFLNKPCSNDNLIEAIKAGIKQYRLIVAEKILLNKTLKGVLNVLNEVLNLVNPDVATHNAKLRHNMIKLAETLKLQVGWSFEPMIQLSQLGCVILPPDTINHITSGQALSAEERQLFEQHPCLASDLIRKIPRMEKIAETILYQEKHYNGEGVPHGEVKGDQIPLHSRMLKTVLDYIRFEGVDGSPQQALKKMEMYKDRYDPQILAAFFKTINSEPMDDSGELTLTYADLKEKMILLQDIRTPRGQFIAKKGQEITEPLYRIIIHCLDNGALSRVGLIKVQLPQEAEEELEEPEVKEKSGS